jgi:hypothetical protein
MLREKIFSHLFSTKFTILTTSIHTPIALQYKLIKCKNEISFVQKPLITHKLVLVILIYVLPEDGPFGLKTYCIQISHIHNKQHSDVKDRILLSLYYYHHNSKKQIKIWSIALYGAKTWTFWKIDQNKFQNVVLEKDRDQLDRSCEKWINITNSQEGGEYPTNNKKKEG